MASISSKSGALEIVDLHKSYGAVQVLKGVTIQANQGEFISLVGPSGCGKTTTLNIVGGFEHPDGGDVRLNGESVVPLPPHKRGLGMVFQNHALFPHMSILANVGFGLAMRGVPKAEVTARARDALRTVRLDGFESRYPRELSGGQQQRVGIARALTVSPKVLLMDEPLSSLDAKLRREMQVELRRIQQSVGITALYVTHDQEEALSLSDRIVLMNRGRIEQSGSAQEIYSRPATAFAADFIGESSFLSGILREIRGDESLVELPGNEQIVVPTRAGLSPGQKVRIAVRPDKLRLAPAGATQSVIHGKVAATAYLGSIERVLVRLADGREIQMTIRVEDGLPAIDDAVSIQANIRDWMVFPGDEQ